jgi:hypothetical protein
LHAGIVPTENSASASAVARSAAFDQHSVWTTWKIYCDTCHFGPKPRAGLNLEALDLANLEAKGAAWEKVLRKLRSREMPPSGSPRPDEATYRLLVKEIETERDRLAEVKPNPGRYPGRWQRRKDGERMAALSPARQPTPDGAQMTSTPKGADPA